ncbi:O-antigen ligase family protein [Botrimarina hoheduenensis]|uniref:O-Antigen ligase n=1 Tax=Botrimarina hoheduenensis TaxID=2528000 RepID=A0A5C5WF72_9BACT|nr:O-antigen ligase family protein [Botrimarina hoheduenensis]TWT48751.1 O-Antigen ligase [Botrimarina hoheduenensis]
MIVPLGIAAIAFALLALAVASRASLVKLVVSVVLVGYVLGYDLWHADFGPMPLTLDRLMLIGVGILFTWRLVTRQTPLTQPTAVDWALGLTLGWLTLSWLTSGEPIVPPETSSLFRLLVSFWFPAFLYGVARHASIDGPAARWMMTALASLGIYLAFTALCETAGVWSLVFPKYIANPELGLHFGRARGPGLNSVSLGVYLGVCACAAWLLIPQASRGMKLFWFAAVAAMCLGVLLTYTRSTWIGLAAAIYLVVGLQLPQRIRKPTMIGVAIAGIALLAIGKDAIVGLEREDSGNVSAHSVQQRAAFAYVSARMFADYPLFGVGFGRFYDQKLPYLTDRRQSFELESLRPLHHHNTFLGLLTETGMLGLAAYCAVLMGLGRAAWRLANCPTVDPDCRRLGLLLLGVLAVYLPSALFHDLTLVHSDQWLLMLVGGAGVGCLVNHTAPRRLTDSSPARLQPSLSSCAGTASA